MPMLAAQDTSAVAIAEAQEWRHALERAGAALKAGVDIIAPTYEFSPLPGQPRRYFGDESMKRMIESMKGPLGQVFPGLSRIAPPGSATKYQIIDGERRWRGARAAEIPYRSLVIQVDDNTMPYILAAVANFNRESLSTPEVVNTIDFLRSLKAPWEEIAQMLGSSIQWVQKLHTLKSLRTEVWEMLDPSQVKSRILGTMAAVEIAKLHPSQQLTVAQLAIAQRMTVPAVRAETERVSRGTRHAVAGTKRAPRKTWRALTNGVGVLERISGNLVLALNDDNLESIFQGRSEADIALLLEQLKCSRELMTKVESVLEKRRISAGA